MTGRSKGPPGGFTLIEMMVVAVLLCLLASVVVVNLEGFTQGGRSDAAVARVASACQLARMAAQSGGQSVPLVYDLENQSITWGDATLLVAPEAQLVWVQTGPKQRIEQGRVTLAVMPGGLVPGHAVGLRPRGGQLIVCWLSGGSGQLRRYKEHTFVFPALR